MNINALAAFAHGDHIGAYYERLAGRGFGTLSDAELPALRLEVQRAIAGSARHDVFIKTHNSLATVDGISTIALDVSSAVIYIARNPLDLAVSYADHYAIDLDRTVREICSSGNHIAREPLTAPQILGSWSDHVRSWLFPPAMAHHLIRYEDVQANPRKAFLRLVRFLKIPATTRQIEQAVRFSAFSELAKQESLGGFIEKPPKASKFFRQGKIGAWKHHLSAHQAATIVETHRDIMGRLGYLKPDGTLVY